MAITTIADIGEVETGQPGNSIFISLNDTGNSRLSLDVRRWYVAGEGHEKEGEWLPTGKGISIPVGKVQSIIDFLTEGLEHPDVVAALAPKDAAPVKKAAGKKVTPRKAAARKR